MIFSIGNPKTDLFVKNILGELFPELIFSESCHIYAESSVSYSLNSVKVSIKINGEAFTEAEEISAHMSDKLATTCALGKAAMAFAKKCGKPLPPYGVLTGVRPFKIAQWLLSKYEKEIAIKRLEDSYLVRKDKIDLLLYTSLYDQRARSEHDRNDCSVYISIPFCPSRCSYCSFISSAAPNKLNLLDDYVNRLIDEINILSRFIEKNHLNVKSIYIGGGTPTILNTPQLSTLLSTLNTLLRSVSLKEFTVEAGRPDTITEEKVSVIKNSGVDRICVNCQTLNDDILKLIGRNHTSDDFYNAFETIKSFNFKTINTDLIAGLPSEALESFQSTLKEIIFLAPENITIHTLCVKKSAFLKADNKVQAISNNSINEYVDYGKKACLSSEYVPYYLYKQKYSLGNHENVGYSKIGHEAYYNIAMMNETESVFGVGAGATSKILVGDYNSKIHHFENYKYPTEYLQSNDKIIDNFKKMQAILDIDK